MRSDGGYEVIKKAIDKLGLRHKEHIAAYGEGNERRLTGRHETADINTFLWVRLPHLIFLYFSVSVSFTHIKNIIHHASRNLVLLCLIDREWRIVEHRLGLGETQRKRGKDTLKTEGLLLTWTLMLSLL